MVRALWLEFSRVLFGNSIPVNYPAGSRPLALIEIKDPKGSVAFPPTGEDTVGSYTGELAVP